MDITNKSLTELKAIAYDLLVQIQGMQSSLNVVNDLIAKKAKEETLGEQSNA